MADNSLSEICAISRWLLRIHILQNFSFDPGSTRNTLEELMMTPLQLGSPNRTSKLQKNSASWVGVGLDHHVSSTNYCANTSAWSGGTTSSGDQVKPCRPHLYSGSPFEDCSTSTIWQLAGNFNKQHVCQYKGHLCNVMCVGETSVRRPMNQISHI